MTATKGKSSERAGGQGQTEHQSRNVARSKRAADQLSRETQTLAVGRSSSPSNGNGKNPTIVVAEPKREASGSSNGSQSTKADSKANGVASAASPTSEVREVIRSLIAEGTEPDPDAIASAAMGQIRRRDTITALARYAVTHLAREEIRSLRGPRSPERITGPSRWQRARLNLPHLGTQIFVDGLWQWVEECTADDLLSYANDQADRAAAIQHVVDTCRELARAMVAAGAETVGDWDAAGRPGVSELDA